jgi:hypothetical protein
MMVDFFIVGAPKCGTTSLHRYLDNHSSIFMSNPKETNFFSYDDIESDGLYYKEKRIENLDDYEKIFESAGKEMIKGEASVSYLYYPAVPRKIYDYNSSAKIIIVLRDPIKRAYSHYLMDQRLGYCSKPFFDIVKEGEKSVFYRQYIGVSSYYEQVKRYIEIFGKENVLVITDVELRESSTALWESLCGFLNVSYVENIDTGKVHNAYKKPRGLLFSLLYKSAFLRKTSQKVLPKFVADGFKNIVFKNSIKPKMDMEVEEVLKDLFFEDVRNLESLLNRKLFPGY